MSYRNLMRLGFALVLFCATSQLQVSAISGQGGQKSAHASPLSSGSVSNGVYRNAALGFSCKVPPGWVLRTDEMNQNDEGQPASQNGGRVLLAAFSRPPDARAEDVNSSILIAAEPSSAYPGLKEAVQYFGPIEEVTKSQGFEVSEGPYELQIDGKPVPREDFQKNVGTRLMHQSTLVMLERGYAISFTFIGGTEDEVTGLINGLNFEGRTHAPPKK